MITGYTLNNRKIFGTDVEQLFTTSDKFPKLMVTLYAAPAEPEKIIAMDYKECIENLDIVSPDDISSAEALKVAKWALDGGHTPALEAINLCFLVRGMSRVVSHQLVRHRIGTSIGQKTQRANSEEMCGKFFDAGHYIVPPTVSALISKYPSIANMYKSYMQSAQEMYNVMIENDIPQEDARYHLPHNMETSMSFKVIYKSLQHVASVRLCHMMMSENTEIVKMMVECVKNYSPLLGNYLKPTCATTGVCNRNENNPTDEYPKGVCDLTVNGIVPARDRSDTYNLTKFSRDNSK